VGGRGWDELGQQKRMKEGSLWRKEGGLIKLATSQILSSKGKEENWSSMQKGHRTPEKSSSKEERSTWPLKLVKQSGKGEGGVERSRGKKKTSEFHSEKRAFHRVGGGRDLQ